ncbi:MAG: hypothetical protein ABIH72_01165 [archaeon]
MIQDYETLVDRIMKASGLGREEIDRRVEAKRAKLSGLISKEGAIQIISAELGINFDKQKVKINEIMPGMRKINLTGKIIQMFPVREYKKGEREGKIGSFILADETANVKVVLWDTNHIKLIEDGSIKKDNIIDVSNASLRNNEIHLTGFSDIKLSSEKLDNVKTERSFFERKLDEVKIGESMKSRAVIMQIFEPRFFYVCPECSKKATPVQDGYTCEAHGKVVPERRVLITLVLDDGTENIRAVLFSEQINQLGFKELEGEGFLREKEIMLGKEAMFSGSLRQNKLFNTKELFIDKIEDLDIEKLIEALENKR